MKVECWHLRNIDNILAVDKKACKKIFGRLTALTEFIHNIEGSIIELHIISCVSEKMKSTLRWGKRMWGKIPLADLNREVSTHDRDIECPFIISSDLRLHSVAHMQTWPGGPRGCEMHWELTDMPQETHVPLEHRAGGQAGGDRSWASQNAPGFSI